MLNNGLNRLLMISIICGPVMGLAKTSKISEDENQPDNTKVNVRDTKRSEVTAQDQARGSDMDVETTRNIRSRIMDDGSLSTYAKNVKIVTLNGVVTLKGPVKNNDEKAKVERYARSFAKGANVSNQLDVVPSSDEQAR